MSGVRHQTDPVSRSEANRQLYEADEHEWMAQQIAAMRSGRFHELDYENIAEFLEDSMKRDRRELRSRFSRLLQHQLKVSLQPEQMTRSWLLTIVHQQNEIKSILRDIPSIRQHADRLFTEAYADAIREAAAETGIPARQFPAASPWTIEESISYAAPELPSPSVSRQQKTSRSGS